VHVFPVLERFPALRSSSPNVRAVKTGSKTHRAETALSELFMRLGRSRLLVVSIDIYIGRPHSASLLCGWRESWHTSRSCIVFRSRADECN